MRSNICCRSDRCDHVEAVITTVKGALSAHPLDYRLDLLSALPSSSDREVKSKGKQERRRGVCEAEVSRFVFKEGCRSHGDRSVIAFVLRYRK